MSNRTIDVAFYRNAKDNLPRMESMDWIAFRDNHLSKPKIVPRGPSHEEAKKNLPAFSLASFPPGTKRAKKNVQHLDGLVLDFDQAKDVPHVDPVTPEEVRDILFALDVEAAFYETFSSTPEWPKFRVVLPTASPVLPGDWHLFVDAALAQLGLDSPRILAAIDLAAVKDVARLWFLPAEWAVQS